MQIIILYIVLIIQLIHKYLEYIQYNLTQEKTVNTLQGL